ncbi:MAG: class I SAM-dependent methyltransferase [Chloroflexota bacterium]
MTPSDPPSGEFTQHSRRNLERWEATAAWWDERVGEADAFHSLLINPATEKLLALKPGERALDIACGNGGFSRRMAALGAEVVGFDASPTFIRRARERTNEHSDRISFMVMDAADHDGIAGLGERAFDAAVCKMALMDIPEIYPLMSALAEVLKPGGRFVFSVTHPAFNSSGHTMCAEEIETENGELVVDRSVRVRRYATPIATLGTGIRGQPRPHYNFHRPISLLLTACFSAGFVVDALEEPTFEAGTEPGSPFGWAAYPDIPPAMIVRARLPLRDA